MTEILTTAQARQKDAWAIQELGFPSLVLMEHAAQGMKRLLDADLQPVYILCGPGNNGADGFALARLLHHEGRSVSIFFPEGMKMSEEEIIQHNLCEHLGIPMSSSLTKPASGWVVDALFGSGLSRPLTGIWKEIVDEVNGWNLPVLSCDIASGLDGTTGNILGCAVRAKITACIDSIKTGQLAGAGPETSGQLALVDIGIPAFDADACLLDEAAARTALPSRNEQGHKGTFGKVLMLGGSQNMPGALAYAGQAAFHAGAGLVTLCFPKSLLTAYQAKFNAFLLQPAPEENGFFQPDPAFFDSIQEKYTTLCIGNGMGPGQAALVKAVLKTGKPAVLDADAIRVLDPQDLHDQTVITPHAAEFAALAKADLADVLNNPLAMAQEFTKVHPGVLVLKSWLTVISFHGKGWVLDKPNSALAKGGSGDVLAGIITGLMAQGASGLAGALAGVWLHSLSAAQKKDPAAFQPQDLIDGLNEAFQSLRNSKPDNTL